MREAGGRPLVEIELGRSRQTVDPLQVRVLELLRLFGSKAEMAEHFGVRPSQPGRWARGVTPAGAVARHLTDLAFVWDRATEGQADDVVRVWLSKPNRILGERPLDAVKGGRVAEVIGAWDTYMEDAFS